MVSDAVARSSETTEGPGKIQSSFIESYITFVNVKHHDMYSVVCAWILEVTVSLP